MSVPVVVLDACVLYPAALRDLFMRLAVHGLIQAKWSDSIHNEWIEAVCRVRADLSREQLERTRRLMDLHAADSLVTGFEHHVERFQLPDPDDRHVLAVALEARAEAIVTWNLRDFPAAVLGPLGVTVESPDDLILMLLNARRDAVLAVVRETRLSLKHPPRSAAEYLGILRAQWLVKCCEVIERHMAAI